jgi:endonuclease III
VRQLEEKREIVEQRLEEKSKRKKTRFFSNLSLDGGRTCCTTTMPGCD